jgi:hypothetical protein
MTALPEKGFYRHYKHAPDGAQFNYTYEVVGVARHTEEKTFTVLYRPLYENEWIKPADLNARPLEMFVGTVEKEGIVMSRFAHITDPTEVKVLEQVRDRMYPSMQP